MIALVRGKRKDIAGIAEPTSLVTIVALRLVYAEDLEPRSRTSPARVYQGARAGGFDPKTGANKWFI